MTNRPIIEIYQNPETDEFTVTCEGFDGFSTFSEQEALDEAEAMADEVSGEIRRQ